MQAAVATAPTPTLINRKAKFLQKKGTWLLNARHLLTMFDGTGNAQSPNSLAGFRGNEFFVEHLKRVQRAAFPGTQNYRDPRLTELVYVTILTVSIGYVIKA
jgi:hypothetical protein